MQTSEDVSGFIDHMDYVAEMASTGIYDIRALVAYDERMLERARNWGVAAFHGADSHSSNTTLGVSGMKGVNQVQRSGGNSKNYSQNRNTSHNQGCKSGTGQTKLLTGWR